MLVRGRLHQEDAEATETKGEEDEKLRESVSSDLGMNNAGAL